MSEQSDGSKIEEATVVMISHISIRDPDSNAVILRQRDRTFEKAANEHDDR